MSNNKIHITSYRNPPRDSCTALTACISESENPNNVDTDMENSNPPSQLHCRYCGSTFSSRNEIFRHLRDSNCHLPLESSQRDHNDNKNYNIPLPPSGTSLPKQSIAIRFGYYYDNEFPYVSESSKNELGINEKAVEIIRNAFHSSVKAYDLSKSEGNYATSARSRNIALSQDTFCCAASDVLVISYRASSVMNDESLQEVMNNCIRGMTAMVTNGIVVRVLDIHVTNIPPKFHAEKDCTQRVYHYLLPLKWLRDSEDAENWLLHRFRSVETNDNIFDSRQDEVGLKAPIILSKLKENLRLACSRTASNRRERRMKKTVESGKDSVMSPNESNLNHKFVTSTGRYGALWRKERRCLHNFADSKLRGLASPNSEAVWRCIDRVGIVDVIIDNMELESGEKKESITLVIELRGDSFLTGEVNRIIGSTVAICNGWLPRNFWDFATRPDVILETPIAPEGRSYLSTARYHHLEVQKGYDIFNIQTEGSLAWQQELRCHLLKAKSHPEAIKAEDDWLSTLENNQSLRIQSQIEKISMDDSFREYKAQESSGRTVDQGPDKEHRLFKLTTAPKIYERTLNLLRDLVQNGQWPPTSQARSRVIRKSFGHSSYASQNREENNENNNNQSGSFTVVNEELHSGPLPRANEIFPELTKAVFELESSICQDQPLKAADGTFLDQTHAFPRKRMPSTHCAINRNAEFTPHVDSGRGEGQSLSLIVGLGDFDRGGLVVEGKPYHIRYQPLEFDGWNQIHYTEPFEGDERFSLVWFTPEKRR